MKYCTSLSPLNTERFLKQWTTYSNETQVSWEHIKIGSAANPYIFSEQANIPESGNAELKFHLNIYFRPTMKP